MVFVNSMSDLFHERVPVPFIQAVFATMAACPQHVFQLLTKRSTRVRELRDCLPWPVNVWMGVSVEDARVVHRIDDLRAVPAAVRFLSCEPLIGPLARVNLENIQWVIVGGESGPGARPMESAWVREVRDQCRQVGTAFFFKQWGGVQKHVNGRVLDGQLYDEFPARVLPGDRLQTEVPVGSQMLVQLG
jgi:protein gp37